MPSLGCFRVAYKWMYGGTLKNAREQYDEFIRQGRKQAMFEIIKAYKDNAAKAFWND